MVVPLAILTFGSIFVGYFFKDMFVGLGTDFWNGSIFVLSNHSLQYDSEFIPFYIKIIPVVFSLVGAFSAFSFYENHKIWLLHLKTTPLGLLFYRFLNQRWYFDVVYNYFVVRQILNFGYKISFLILDRGFFEFLGPQGLVIIAKNISLRLSNMQSGFIYHYVSLMVIGILFILGLFFFNYLGFTYVNDEVFFIFIFLSFFILLSDKKV